MMVCQTRKGLTFGVRTAILLVTTQNFCLRRSTTVSIVITLRHYLCVFLLHICRKLCIHPSYKQLSSFIAMMVCQTRKGLTFGAGKRSGQQFFFVKNQNFCSTTVNITLRHYQSSVSFFSIYVGSFVDIKL